MQSYEAYQSHRSYQPFLPPSVFHANRKASAMRRVLARAGAPFSLEACRETVARAWGWVSWAEMADAVASSRTPSPMDADLLAPDARRGAMGYGNEGLVAQRKARSTAALLAMTGLPANAGHAVVEAVRFTDYGEGSGLARHGFRTEGEAGICGADPAAVAAAAETVRFHLSTLTSPRHAGIEALAESLGGRGPLLTAVPPLPAHRPR